jgi:CRISPR-associated protein Csb2
MLRHYGIADNSTSSRLWRSVTPCALPESATRRRIEPTRQLADAKDGAERVREQRRAAAAVAQALRHANVDRKVNAIRVQREPFIGNGERVEAFAADTRFQKGCLWHVEISFEESVAGPLVIGDGRFLGLGVMAPVPHVQGVYMFAIESGLVDAPAAGDLARALRRAVMARAQTIIGDKPLPAFFCGHEPGGAPVRSTGSSHLAFSYEPGTRRLVVVAPHALDRRAPARDEHRHLATLDQALQDLEELRAGAAGHLRLRAIGVELDDPLTASSRTWESVTPYQVTRHTKGVTAADALVLDLAVETRRRGLPTARVVVLDSRGVSGIGLVGWLRLEFAVAITGPVLLGRDRYAGGGLFMAASGLAASNRAD